MSELDELEKSFEIEPLPREPLAAVLAASRLQADDEMLEALLMAEHGMDPSAAAAMLEERYSEIIAQRRMGQLDLVRHAHAVVKHDPASPPAVSLLRVLLTNHMGWSTAGVDAEMRKQRRALERMTPAERAKVLEDAGKMQVE